MFDPVDKVICICLAALAVPLLVFVCWLDPILDWFNQRRERSK